MANRTKRQLPAGKIPADLLKRQLSQHALPDNRVIIGASVGIDAAAIDFGETALVVKSDPITFPTPDAGYYLVNVNANDVACLGADPKWLLVTALLPEGATSEEDVEVLFTSLSTAARDLGISLVGGHTEITSGLDRPILCGTLLGEAPRNRLFDLSTARPGDAIILCKGIAIEGTSILATEFVDELRDAVDDDVLERASHFITDPGISVVAAASIIRTWNDAVRGMHDPTEGGIATALHELAEATHCGMQVFSEAIAVLPETAQICAELGVDPLGLIASGALLAVVDSNCAPDIVRQLERTGIPSAIIGQLTESEDRVFVSGGNPGPIPTFEVDEIARLFAGLAPD